MKLPEVEAHSMPQAQPPASAWDFTPAGHLSVVLDAGKPGLVGRVFSSHNGEETLLQS